MDIYYCDCGCPDNGEGCVYRSTTCPTCKDQRAFTGLYGQECFFCEELENIRRYRLHNSPSLYAE